MAKPKHAPSFPSRTPFLQHSSSVGLAGLLAVLCLGWACKSRGQVYVGTPNVQTRERLVGERIREREWIQRQLAAADEIETTFQGYQDLRTFTGLVSEFRAAVDTGAASLNRIRLDAQESQDRADRYDARTAELLAQRNYEAVRDGGTGNGTTPEIAAPSIPTPPTAEAPLGRGANDTPAYQDPSKVEATKAKASAIDLFRDKLAYRDEVNSALKRSQLDDAHDAGGSMLYELGFNLTLVPGEDSQRFVQVDLDLKQSDSKRQYSLRRLFLSWREHLERSLPIETAGLARSLCERKLADFADSELEYLLFALDYLAATTRGREHSEGRLQNWFASWETRHGNGGTSHKLCGGDCQRELDPDPERERDWRSGERELIEDFLRTIEQERSFRLLEGEVVEAASEFYADMESLEEKGRRRTRDSAGWRKAQEKVVDSACRFRQELRALAASDKCIGSLKLDDLDKVLEQLARLAEARPLDLQQEKQGAKTLVDYLVPKKVSSKQREKDKDDTRIVLRKAAAWATWSKYERALARIVTITPPEFCTATGRLQGGMGVTPVIATGRESGYLGAPLWGIRLPRHNVLHSTGDIAFARRLLEAEQRMHALEVEPKEVAQNISSVGARESLTNLIFALQLSAPELGASANQNLQHLQKSMELMHGITRKPLLIGFGQGQSTFGWIFGPRFEVKDAESQFLHTPVRHDFSAAIVLPAWRDRVRIRGSYQWINRYGNPEGTPKALWADEDIEIRLPMPQDWMDKITDALVFHTGGIGNLAYGSATRPIPRVTFPSAADKPTPLLIAGQKGQQLLIRGEHLWRNPQVFAGSQPASRVEVVADMGGLLATFDAPRFPGKPGASSKDQVLVSLVVTTAFGTDVVEEALAILPAPEKKNADANKPDAEAAAKLLSLYVDDVQKTVSFQAQRPNSYAKVFAELRAKGQARAAIPIDGDRWSADGKRVEFDVPAIAAAPAGIYEIDLRVQARAGDSRTESLLPKGRETFARFATARDRAAKLRPDDGKDVKRTFGHDGKVDAPIELLLPNPETPMMFVAYPGLEASLGKQTVKLLLQDELGERVGNPLALRASKVASGRLLVAEKPVLDGARQILLSHKGETLSLLLQVQNGKKETLIPVANQSKSGTLVFDFLQPAKHMPSLETASLSYGASGKLDDDPALRMRILKAQREEFSYAYENLRNALPNGVWRLRATSQAGEPLGVDLPVELAESTGDRLFLVHKGALEPRKVREALVKAGPNIQLHLAYGPTGTLADQLKGRIEVEGKVTATFAALTAAVKLHTTGVNFSTGTPDTSIRMSLSDDDLEQLEAHHGGSKAALLAGTNLELELSKGDPGKRVRLAVKVDSSPPGALSLEVDKATLAAQKIGITDLGTPLDCRLLLTLNGKLIAITVSTQLTIS